MTLGRDRQREGWGVRNPIIQTHRPLPTRPLPEEPLCPGLG